MMAALPYLQFHPSDYLADTQHLTTTEHGAYLLLIFNYWQQGHPLKDCDRRFSNITRLPAIQWMDMRAIIEEFFTIQDGVWIHNRIEDDLAYVREKVAKAKSAGEASGRSRRKPSTVNLTNDERTFNERSTNAPTDDERKGNYKDNITINNKDQKSCAVSATNETKKASSRSVHDALTLSFETFWTPIIGKIGKQPALKAWLKLKPLPEFTIIICQAWEEQEAERALKLKHGVWIAERRHPSTWINQRGFDDEVMTEDQIRAKAANGNGNHRGNGNGNRNEESPAERYHRLEQSQRDALEKALDEEGLGGGTIQPIS